jgi:hypothetical protein
MPKTGRSRLIVPAEEHDLNRAIDILARVSGRAGLGADGAPLQAPREADF